MAHRSQKSLYLVVSCDLTTPSASSPPSGWPLRPPLNNVISLESEQTSSVYLAVLQQQDKKGNSNANSTKTKPKSASPRSQTSSVHKPPSFPESFATSLLAEKDK
jgi:hypothetical protein